MRFLFIANSFFVFLNSYLFNVQLAFWLKLALRFWSEIKGFRVNRSTKVSDRIHLSERRIAVKAEAS